jgi:hypothetical protein
MMRAIVADDARKTARLVDNSPTLVHVQPGKAPSLTSSRRSRIVLYAGGTALHMAAAGFKPEIAQAFIDRALTVSQGNGAHSI